MKILLIIIATYYSNRFEGRKTYSEERFRQSLYSAATWKYPIGSIIEVKNLSNNKTVIVCINDRPKSKHIIDLSKKAFKELSDLKIGRIKVKTKDLNEQ